MEKGVNTPFRMKAQEIRAKTRLALLLALGATVISAPMYYYKFSMLVSRTTMHEPTSTQLMKLTAYQSFMMLAASILCCMVGLLYAERLSLPGLGKWRDLKVWAPVSLVAGLLFTVAAYFISDGRLMEQVPEFFPRPWYWALAEAAGKSLREEVIGRLGLLTIAVYFLRWFNFKGHPWPAILITVLFSVMSALMFNERFGYSGRIEPMIMNLSLVSIAVSQWVYAEVFIRKGFIAAVCLHFGLLLKLVIYTFLK